MRVRVFCGLVLCSAFVFYGFLSVVGPTSQRNEVSSRLSGPLSATDPRVVRALRNHFLEPPSTAPYNLTNHAWFSKGTNQFTWPWIHHHLLKLFAGETRGFFLEAGALDGEYLSNTLWLERDLGWSGLLIEAEANSYRALLGKHRKAWSSNTCLSSEPYPKEVIFVSHFTRVKLIDISPWSARSHGHELRKDVNQDAHNLLDEMAYSSVQCFPLISYLTALNVSTVDLLSLDIQGTEVPTLTNLLSYSSVSVRVIVAENEYGSFDGGFLELMSDKGYRILAKAIDYIFVKEGDPVLQKEEVASLLKKIPE